MQESLEQFLDRKIDKDKLSELKDDLLAYSRMGEVIVGTPANVKGGLSVQHVYIVKITKGKTTLYVKKHEEETVYTEEKSNAMVYRWSKGLDELKNLHEKGTKCQVVLEPISFYSRLRD